MSLVDTGVESSGTFQTTLGYIFLHNNFQENSSKDVICKNYLNGIYLHINKFNTNVQVHLLFIVTITMQYA